MHSKFTEQIQPLFDKQIYKTLINFYLHELHVIYL